MVKDKFGETVEIDFAKGVGVKDGSGLLPPGSYTYYEEFISEKYSDWTKWCNNYNYFNQDLMREHPHIPAMVHFIYAETKGVFTILDVQGKFASPGGKYKYVLSDPAFVSTMNGTFGPTDFGKAAMKKFFDKHTCNKYCEHLEKPTGAIPDLPPAQGGGSGTGTKTLSIAEAKTSLLQNIGSNKEAFLQIFRALKGTPAGKMLKEVIQQAIDQGDLGKVEKEKAMKNFNEIAEEMEFEW